jgi:hypothetical protein
MDNAMKLGGCCDLCGVTGRNETDEILCRACKLKYERARDKLVADAAEASETFGDDELERFAAEQNSR